MIRKVACITAISNYELNNEYLYLARDFPAASLSPLIYSIIIHYKKDPIQEIHQFYISYDNEPDFDVVIKLRKDYGWYSKFKVISSKLKFDKDIYIKSPNYEYISLKLI